MGNTICTESNGGILYKNFITTINGNVCIVWQRNKKLYKEIKPIQPNQTIPWINTTTDIDNKNKIKSNRIEWNRQNK